MGQLRLPVMVGNKEHSTTAWMNFMVIRSPSPYNGIIGDQGFSAIRAVPIHGPRDAIITRRHGELSQSTIPPHRLRMQPQSHGVTQDQRQHKHHGQTGRSRFIPLPCAEVSIGGSSSDTKKRGQAPERAKAILEEVHKLMEAGIMREVYYHDCLSNPVMVKKSDGSWRMCVDFTDLNKACPQDCYPLPEIDWKVESLCGYPFKWPKMTRKRQPFTQVKVSIAIQRCLLA
ncbi:hypothetical protein Tco_1044527 [Tanacetum coccineum]|uniref:Reverse transcriptase domain-containing protein n=1 Tax=Tanacetum coccineum TaxID=301880 RepID=A0ABQ5GS48_9ASTR